MFFRLSEDSAYEKSITLAKLDNDTLWKLLTTQLIDQVSSNFPHVKLRGRVVTSGFAIDFQGRKFDVDKAVDFTCKKHGGDFILFNCSYGSGGFIEILKQGIDDGVLDLEALASEARVECTLVEPNEKKVHIEVASFSDEGIAAFKRVLDSFLSDQETSVTEEYSASQLELEFLRRRQIRKLVKHDSLALGTSEHGVVLTGPTYSVRAFSQRIKDLLRGFGEETFDVSYQPRAFTAAKAKFYAIQKEYSSPECFIHILPPDSVPKNSGVTRISLAGVNKKSLLAAKQKILSVPRLLDQFSQAVEIPLLNRTVFLEKRIELEKQLGVGLDVRQKDVFVYATSMDQFQKAEIMIKKERSEEEYDIRCYQSSNASAMKTLCSTAWRKVVYLSKSSNVFSERNEDNSAILVRGPSRNVLAFRHALDSFVEDLGTSTSSRPNEAHRDVYRHRSKFVMQTLCTTYWMAVVRRAKGFSVFAQKSPDNESIRIVRGSKLKKAEFPAAIAKFCNSLDTLAGTIEDKSSSSER